GAELGPRRAMACPWTGRCRLEWRPTRSGMLCAAGLQRYQPARRRQRRRRRSHQVERRRRAIRPPGLRRRQPGSRRARLLSIGEHLPASAVVQNLSDRGHSSLWCREGAHMVETYGLTHLALAVSDPNRSAAFYRDVFGCSVSFEDESKVEVQTPDCHDVISFE